MYSSKRLSNLFRKLRKVTILLLLLFQTHKKTTMFMRKMILRRMKMKEIKELILWLTETYREKTPILLIPIPILPIPILLIPRTILLSKIYQGKTLKILHKGQRKTSKWTKIKFVNFYRMRKIYHRVNHWNLISNN